MQKIVYDSIILKSLNLKKKSEYSYILTNYDEFVKMIQKYWEQDNKITNIAGLQCYTTCWWVPRFLVLMNIQLLLYQQYL